MKPAFADAAYWIALINPLDADYERAISFMNDMVTTEEVLTEFLNYYSKKAAHLRRKAGLIAEAALEHASVRVLPQSRETFRAGLSLYNSRPDKGYSLTDCISMETMRREGLTDVLTADRHFEQEGFNALFRVGNA